MRRRTLSAEEEAREKLRLCSLAPQASLGKTDSSGVGQAPALCSDSIQSLSDLTSPPCLGVVMPCYNEAGTVDEIIRRVLDQPVVVELVVVDDGSTDGSWERLQGWPARDGRVRLARHEVNRGKGAAVRSGLALATAPVVVVQDADLEYDPADYAKLLAPILAGQAQVVYGSRFAVGEPGRSPWWHRACNRLLTATANWLTGLRLTDEATCYKMFRREVALGLALEEDGFGFCPEVTAKLARAGVPIVEVPIHYHGRTRAEGKKLRLRHGLEAVRCLWKYARGPAAR